MDAEPAGAPEPSAGLRRGNALAMAVFLLWMVALVSPWWGGTRHAEGLEPYTVSWHLWHHPDPATDGARGDAVRVTLVLALLPLPLLFLRLAGNSVRHEPASWRRDVAIAALLMVAALASVLAWPAGLPFWGQEVFPAGGGLPEQRIQTGPAFGWWLGLALAGLLCWAWWLARPGASEK